MQGLTLENLTHIIRLTTSGHCTQGSPRVLQPDHLLSFTGYVSTKLAGHQHVVFQHFHIGRPHSGFFDVASRARIPWEPRTRQKLARIFCSVALGSITGRTGNALRPCLYASGKPRAFSASSLSVTFTLTNSSELCLQHCTSDLPSQSAQLLQKTYPTNTPTSPLNQSRVPLNSRTDSDPQAGQLRDSSSVALGVPGS